MSGRAPVTTLARAKQAPGSRMAGASFVAKHSSRGLGARPLLPCLIPATALSETAGAACGECCCRARDARQRRCSAQRLFRLPAAAGVRFLLAVGCDLAFVAVAVASVLPWGTLAEPPECDRRS